MYIMYDLISFELYHAVEAFFIFATKFDSVRWAIVRLVTWDAYAPIMTSEQCNVCCDSLIVLHVFTNS